MSVKNKNQFLGDGCHWELTWDGKKIVSEMGLDDQDLDLFLMQHVNDFKLSNGAIFYSKSALDITAEKVSNIENDVKGVQKVFDKSKNRFTSDDTGDFDGAEDVEKIITYIPKSLGITKVITDIKFKNGKPFVTPMDMEKYKTKKISDLKAGVQFTLPSGEDLNRLLKSYSAEQLLAMEEKSWERLTSIGTSVHKVLEDVFKDVEPVNTDPFISETTFNNLVNQAKAFKQSLIEKHGPDCKFYPELAIKSKNLSQDALAALNASGYDSINGVIDLLVIDKDGKANIYDYKVSRKRIAREGESNIEGWNITGNEVIRNYHLWASTKKLSASYQTEFYKQMVRGYNIKVAHTYIVPIHIDLNYQNEKDPFEVTGINENGISIQYSNDQIIRDPGQMGSGGAASNVIPLFSMPIVSTPDDITKMAEAWNTFFPKSDITIKREQARSTVEFYKNNDRYVHKLKPNEYKYEEGKKIYRLYLPQPGATVEYCEESEVENKINNFIANQSETQSSKFTSIANTIYDIKENGENEDNLYSLIKNKDALYAFKNQFNKYLQSDWSFEPDESANSIGILVFKKGTKSEVVVLSSALLKQSQNLGKGTSILGKTDSDKVVDTRKVLPATLGNMELIKAVMYIALHPESFSNSQISEIRAFNPWLGIETSAFNSDLLYAYSELLRKNPGSGLPNVKNSLFMKDTQALVEGAIDQIPNLDLMLDLRATTNDDNYYTAEWFQSKIDLFEKKFGKELDFAKGYQNTPEWEAYTKLREGLNFCKGFKTHIENDKGDWATGKFFELNGLMMSSPQFSASSNIRELAQIIDEYAKEIRLQVFTIGAPLQMAFKKFYESHGVGASKFDIFFADREKLILKDPDSADFSGDEDSRNLLRIILKTLAKLKHPDYNEKQLENAKFEDELYYAVPLLEAKAWRQIKNLGFLSTVKNKFKQYKTLTEGLFMGEEISGGMATYISENHELYNKLRCDSFAVRQQRIDQYGYGMFETDLELVMNAALVAYCRANVSKDYIPVIAGFKIALDRADARSSNSRTSDMKNIRKRFDDIVKKKFYGESIVPENLQPLLKFLNVVKSAFTSMTLSLNVRSFVRETLQGIWTGLARAGVKLYPGINKKEYVDALTYVIHDVGKTFSGVSMLQQMNAIYAMANQTISQLANQRRLNWAHINHWSKDTMYLTCIAPDFLHRMSLLIAKMKGDGSFDAHSLDENGILKYDFTKDKRFEHLVNNDTSNENYLKEKSLYITMIDYFKQEGFKNADGSELNADRLDPLPQAYTRQEAQSIKNYADYLYGHYDEESKSLLYDTFLGSIFLQYKTFLTSRLEQWTMHEGVYNIAQMEQQFDDKGNPMYVRFYEDEDGAPHKDILLMGEYESLPDDQKAKCQLYYDYTGLPLQGMLQESFKVVKTALSFDQKKLNEVWSDPTTRSMFWLQLHDLWFMAFMTLIINMILSNWLEIDNPKLLNNSKFRSQLRAKANPLEGFTYDVITGSLADSQLPNILNSFTDRPPMITAVQRFVKSSYDVIIGDQNLAYWATRNFGALRDFESLVKREKES